MIQYFQFGNLRMHTPSERYNINYFFHFCVGKKVTAGNGFPIDAIKTENE